MNKIFSIIDPDVIERLRERNNQGIIKTKGLEKTIVSKQPHSSTAQELQAAQDFLSAHNRLALRNERVLQGLMSAKDLLERPAPQDWKEAELNTLIAQTRFHDEPVLNDYAKTLRSAVRDNDSSAVDYLVLEFQNKLASAAKDRVIRENLSAASSLIPEDLLKDVVHTIKSQGLPEISITRQRALDLLRNPE